MLIRPFALVALLPLALPAATASAQTQIQTQAPAQTQSVVMTASSVPERRWSFDFGLGWDMNVSGNINAGLIGEINGQAVVTRANSYEDVYGTGVHVRFAGGYKLDNLREVRAVVTYQSLDADLTLLGDIGFANLYAQYDDYRAFTLDVGYRMYVPNTVEGIRVYGEGTVGLGFITELDVELAAPAINQTFEATDYYDGTAAFALGFNAGVLFTVAKQTDINVQLGLRYMTGLSEVDAFAGTGLEEINSGSSRWTMPLVVGLSFRF